MREEEYAGAGTKQKTKQKHTQHLRNVTLGEGEYFAIPPWEKGKTENEDKLTIGKKKKNNKCFLIEKISLGRKKKKH